MRARRGSSGSSGGGSGRRERQARRRETLARLAAAAAADPVVVDVHVAGDAPAATITLRGGATIRALGVHAPAARRIPAGARLVDAHHPGPCYGLYFADRGGIRPLLAADLRVDEHSGGAATPPPAGGGPAAAATAARTPAPTR